MLINLGLVTASHDWGTGNAVIFRALSIAEIASSGEEWLMRTHHPLLSHLRNVWAADTVFGRPVWAIDIPPKGVEAGGRTIHLLPANHNKHIPCGIIPPWDPYRYNIYFGWASIPGDF